MTLKNRLDKTGEAFKRYAPEILTGASVLGLGATTYFTGRASFKAGLLVAADATEKMESASEGEDVQFMGPKEIIKETWKFYIPAMVIGLATCTAIISSNSISRNRQIAMISAAAIAEQSYREYKDKVIEETTKPKARKIEDAVAQDKIDEKKDEINGLVLKNDGDVVCIEMYTGRTFVSTANKIHKAENDINRIVNNEGYASHNDFMTLLGLPSVEAGEAVGWSNDCVLEVLIGAGLHEETEPVLTVGYRRNPKVGYNSPWG